MRSPPRAFGAGGRDPRLGRRLDPQAVDEAILEIVGEVEAVTIGFGAVGFRQLGVALGIDALVLAVVGDAIRFQNTALIIDLHIADRADPVLVTVIDDLTGIDEHPSVVVGLGAGGETVVQRLRLGHDRRRKRQNHERHRAQKCFAER